MELFGKSSKQIIEEQQAEIAHLKSQLTPEQRAAEAMQMRIQYLKSQITALEDEVTKKQQTLTQQSQAAVRLQQQADMLSRRIYDLQEEIVMQEYGVYRPTYEFANSDLYKERLKQVRDAQKALIKSGKACTGNMGWMVNGNASQGKRMVTDMQKLLIRAFNLECDDVIANVKISNLAKSRDRIHAAAMQVSNLGKIMAISITADYINLKLRELALALDFAQKKQEEKERIRELKEQEREVKALQKEIEAARKKLQKEQAHYQNALQTLEAQLEKDPDNPDLLAKKAEIAETIAETERAITNVDYRAANAKAGYVYIISNIGAFGENVYKIGMTRRLEPMERITELGDASVPFAFDVHALIFSDDAPALEAALHIAFESRKVNKVNHRREFFAVTLDEIKRVVRENFDKTVEWIDVPEADQYRQSLVMAQEAVTP